MNEPENILQERIEQLEAGTPLEVCLAGLTEEDARVVRLAATMQSVPFEQVDEAVAAQRENVLAAAAASTQPAKTAVPSQSFAGSFVTWLQYVYDRVMSQPKVAVGLAVALVLIIFVGAWAMGRAGQPTMQAIAGKEKPASEQEIAAAERDVVPEGTSDSESGEVSEADEAVTAVSQSAYQAFAPILHITMDLGPQNALLENPRGLVEIQTNENQWVAVTGQKVLQASHRLRTGNLSGAQLAFFDGSQATIGPNTEISIDQLNAQRPEAGFRTVVMTQWRGDSTHQVQFRNDGGSLYEVKTATGSGVARGTEFQVQVSDDEQSRFTVTEGKVDVTNADQTVSVIAGQTTAFTAEEPPEEPQFIVTGEGEVTEIGDTWVIAGQSFTVDENTVITGDPQVGDLVRVEGHLVEEGDPVADSIELLHESEENRFSLTGAVESMGDGSWIVAGQTISVTADTEIDDDIEVGDTVQVSGIILLPDGNLVAETIALIEDDPGLPFEFTGIVQIITDEAWTISGIVITVDADTEIDADIEMGDTVSVEGWILEDDTWLASEIKRLEDDEATFTFTGEVMSIDPWVVAGISFEVGDWTQIEPGIEVGDTVRVSGVILEDGTWVADTIELLDGDILQIVFVGEVESTDPWIVSGLPITTDENTIIDDDIEEGDLVRVTAWIRTDGTWLAISIEKLSSGTGEGCVAITAVITGINGDEVILSDGQTIILDGEIVIEGELTVGSVVLIVACVDEDGTIVIISITIIYTPPPPPSDPTPPSDPPPGGGGSVTLCHKPGTPAEQTKTVPASAVGGHLGHGDTEGPCS